MLELLLWGTGGAILLAMIIAYTRTRDPLHPMMYLGPMLFYIYVYLPAVLFYRALLLEYFPSVAKVEFAQLVSFFGVSLFCVGCLIPQIPASAPRLLRIPQKLNLRLLRRLRIVSFCLAALGLTAFLYRLSLTGGFIVAYSGPKGGGVSGPSGYVSAAPLLTIPATILYLLSRGRPKLDLKTVLVILLFTSPHWVHGFLATSRGTIFITFGTIIFGWYLATARRPPLGVATAVIVGIGLLMLLLASQRQQIFIGSDFEFNQETFMEALAPSEVHVSHTTVYSMGLIIASREHQRHPWGRRYFTQIFVRPIPRQLWPTKYYDMGVGYMVDAPGSAGISKGEWVEAVGWSPNAGSACGMVADSYFEFSWGGVLVCLLLGWLYGILWRRAVLFRGVWSLIYLEASVVSVYIPTQSVASAWGYRFLYLTVPSLLLWRFVSTFRMPKKQVAKGEQPVVPTSKRGRPVSPGARPAENA